MDAAQRVITITAWRRPQYLRRVLEALSRCTGVDGYRILLSVDGGYPDRQEEISGVAGSIGVDAEVIYHDRNLGCAGNTFFALEWGFSQPVASVIHLEDDTEPSQDFLRYMEACLGRYAGDHSVFTVSGHQRRFEAHPGHGVHCRIGPGDEGLIRRRQWFTPWGWAIWRDRWEEVRDGWFGMEWRKWRVWVWRRIHRTDTVYAEGRTFRRLIRESDKGSWGIPMNQYWRRGRWEIAPDVSRVQNIGAEDGMWNPGGRWHRIHQRTPIWMGDGRHSTPDRYREEEETLLGRHV